MSALRPHRLATKPGYQKCALSPGSSKVYDIEAFLKSYNPSERIKHQRAIMDGTVGATTLDPIAYLADFMAGNVLCRVCRGKLITKFRTEAGDVSERECQSCWGTGFEKITPKESRESASELAGFMHAKRRPVDAKGEAETSINQIQIVINPVRADQREPVTIEGYAGNDVLMGKREETSGD